MTTKDEALKAVAVLRQHNEWRCDNTGFVEEQSPMRITKAIEDACHYIESAALPAVPDGPTAVHVCPEKDTVCGDRPAGWCSPCPKRGAMSRPAGHCGDAKDAAVLDFLEDESRCYWVEVQRQPDGVMIYAGSGPALRDAILTAMSQERSNGCKPLDQPNERHDMEVGPCKCGAWHEGRSNG